MWDEFMMLRLAFVFSLMTDPAMAQGLGTWCNPVFGCIQVTCELVRWGAATMPQSQIDAYKAQATPAQRAAGQRCLGDKIRKPFAARTKRPAKAP